MHQVPIFNIIMLRKTGNRFFFFFWRFGGIMDSKCLHAEDRGSKDDYLHTLRWEV